MVFADDLVLAMHRGEAGRSLVAVGLDGAERWRLPLDGDSTEVHEARRLGGTLLVTVLDSAAAAEPWTTYGLDPATGERRWQERAYLLGVGPGGATAVLVGMSAALDWYGGWDVASGRRLWRRTLDSSFWLAPHLVDGQLAGMVLVQTVGGGDRVRSVGLDGGLGAARTLPPQASGMQVVGSLAVVAYERAGRRRVAALRLPALETAWDVAPTFDSRHVYLTGCSPWSAPARPTRCGCSTPPTARCAGRAGSAGSPRSGRAGCSPAPTSARWPASCATSRPGPSCCGWTAGSRPGPTAAGWC
ncbi:hypothetical protein ACFQZ4_32535 [Catellatospora coxensis]